MTIGHLTYTPRHILIKLTQIKHKEQILKAAREKQQITHKGIPIRITADLSIETLQARREWQDIFKVLKGKNLQPRLLYPARISFKYEGETAGKWFSSGPGTRPRWMGWETALLATCIPSSSPPHHSQPLSWGRENASP